MRETSISAVDLARRAGVDAKKFRQWLRNEIRAGNSLVCDHDHYGRWFFSHAEAKQLLAQFSGVRRRVPVERRPPSAARVSTGKLKAELRRSLLALSLKSP